MENHLTERELGRLEGIIDSDGSLIMTKESHPGLRWGYTLRTRLYIGSRKREFVQHCQELLGEGSVYERQTPAGKPFWVYNLGAEGLRRLLPQIRLVVKEGERKLFLEVLSLKEKRRHSGSKGRPDTEIEMLKDIWHRYREIRETNRAV